MRQRRSLPGRSRALDLLCAWPPLAKPGGVVAHAQMLCPRSAWQGAALALSLEERRRPRGGVKQRAKLERKNMAEVRRLHREREAMHREDQAEHIRIDKEESDEALLLPLLPPPHSLHSPSSSFVGVVCGIRTVESPYPRGGAGGGIHSWTQAGGGGD